MDDRDIWTIDAMEKYGGSFVKKLGGLARHADRFNLSIIKEAWPGYWMEYEAFGRKMQVEVEKKDD